MNFESDFEGNIKQLMLLIKKMMTQYPDHAKNPEWQALFKSKDAPINVFFFNFFPLGPEELDEIEDMLEKMSSDHPVTAEDVRYELSSDDRRFLKEHGIQF